MAKSQASVVDEEQLVVPAEKESLDASPTSNEKHAEECWEEVIHIGGETVYAFLQFKKIFFEGWIIGVATVVFQLYCFWVFFYEAFQCGIMNDPECSYTSGGLVQTVNGTATLSQDQKVTNMGIAMGILVAVTFLLPDFMKGFVFFRKGYYLIGLVHVLISVCAIVSSGIYAATTAISDVSILTNIVVLLFIVDFDEKMFDIHSSARKFFLNKDYI